MGLVPYMESSLEADLREMVEPVGGAVVAKWRFEDIVLRGVPLFKLRVLIPLTLRAMARFVTSEIILG